VIKGREGGARRTQPLGTGKAVKGGRGGADGVPEGRVMRPGCSGSVGRVGRDQTRREADLGWYRTASVTHRAYSRRPVRIRENCRWSTTPHATCVRVCAARTRPGVCERHLAQGGATTLRPLGLSGRPSDFGALHRSQPPPPPPRPCRRRSVRQAVHPIDSMTARQRP